ncbi:MAG: glucoronyl hydrolase, partial [Hungatella sp.]
MKLEHILEKPEITDGEVKKALLIAIGQTESCLDVFSDQFKGIFSEQGFYTTAENEQWTNG